MEQQQSQRTKISKIFIKNHDKKTNEMRAKIKEKKPAAKIYPCSCSLSLSLFFSVENIDQETNNSV